MNDELGEVTVATYMKQAYELAATSKDTSNQNGAILINPITTGVISTGVNNFPPGVEWSEERATIRPDKYRFCEHSERWAIYEAAKLGNRTDGAHMVCPWAACCDCGRALIVSGVSVLYMHQQRMLMTPDRWRDDVNQALDMLAEAGILLRYYDGPVASDRPVLVNGVPWHPMDKPKLIEEDGSNWAIGMDGVAIR